MVEPEKVIRKAKDRILPGFSTKSKWDQPFFFVQAADTQLGMIDTWGDGSVGNRYPNITWVSFGFTEKIIDFANAHTAVGDFQTIPKKNYVHFFLRTVKLNCANKLLISLTK